MSVASKSESRRVQAFEQHRPLLVSIAHRMLDSLAEAEDVVQEAWLRWDRIDRAQIADVRAFLWSARSSSCGALLPLSLDHSVFGLGRVGGGA